MKTQFKVGDRVFSYSLQEWGKVIEVEPETVFILCVFKNGNDKGEYFTKDGRKLITDKAPDLFFDEVSIKPPKKPLQDKDVIKCWDNEQNFFRGYYFYDSKNKCVFFSNSGLRNGARFDNIVYVPDEEAPQDLVALRDKLED